MTFTMVDMFSETLRIKRIDIFSHLLNNAGFIVSPKEQEFFLSSPENSKKILLVLELWSIGFCIGLLIERHLNLHSLGWPEILEKILFGFAW